jgi:DNA-binding response OmpR family regulator
LSELRPSSQADVSVPSPGRPLLIVEDDPDVRLMMETAFRAEGYDVDVAASAEAAVRLLAARSYALVLTDYHLPRHTGEWLLRQAQDRGLLRGTEALIITSEPEAAAGYERVDVIGKPIDFDRLLPHEIGRAHV